MRPAVEEEIQRAAEWCLAGLASHVRAFRHLLGALESFFQQQSDQRGARADVLDPEFVAIMDAED